MKRIQNILTIGVAFLMSILILGACGVSGKTTTSDANQKKRGDREIVVEHPNSLIELITRAPGVHISNGVPTIRGGHPLYILDGIRQGHDFYGVSGIVNIHDVASVEVLTKPTETLRYGRDVAYGVIIIRTKGN